VAAQVANDQRGRAGMFVAPCGGGEHLIRGRVVAAHGSEPRQRVGHGTCVAGAPSSHDHAGRVRLEQRAQFVCARGVAQKDAGLGGR